MWKHFRKICIDVIFITILYLVSYSNRDSNAIRQVQHIKSLFLNTRSSINNFIKIVSISDFWLWLDNIFIEKIHAQTWYNDQLVENLTDFLDDKSNRMIGWAIMRQMRLKASLCRIIHCFYLVFLIQIDLSCFVPKELRIVIDSCESEYSFSNEDHQSYKPGWTLQSNETYSQSIENAFVYRSNQEIDSYIYFGDHGTYASGGYVYEFLGSVDDLRDNFTILHDLFWIDDLSRAVMIQMNLYNPNVKFFTSVTFLIEILETGEAFPSTRIEPISMYSEFNDFSSIFYLIIAFIYIIFIAFITIFEIYYMIKKKKKYFHRVYSYVEWCIILCSWAGVGVYIARYIEARRLAKHFRQTNGLVYINLQYASLLNDILTFLLGFCCFFGTIRVLRLFVIYPHVNLFIRTLRRALREMFAFSLMFFLLFFAFVLLFYLLFVSKLKATSTLLQTSGMLFEMLLLKFDVTDIQNADAILGPFVFTLFIYFVVFICVTMFVTIITEHLRVTRQEMAREKHNGHVGIFTFVIRDIRLRTGLKRLTDDEKQERIDQAMRSKYRTPVEQLPEKVNELFIQLDKVICTYKESDFMDVSTHVYQAKRRRKKRIVY